MIRYHNFWQIYQDPLLSGKELNETNPSPPPPYSFIWTTEGGEPWITEDNEYWTKE